jgi:hypothetical protein
MIQMMKTLALWFKPLSFIRKSRFLNRLFFAYVTAKARNASVLSCM